MKKIELLVCDGCARPILPADVGIMVIGGAVPINGTLISRDLKSFLQVAQAGVPAFSLPGDEWIDAALAPRSGGIQVEGSIPKNAFHMKCYGTLLGILTPTTPR